MPEIPALGWQKRRTTSSKPVWDIYLGPADQPEVFCEGLEMESGDRTLSSTGVLESKPSLHNNRTKQGLGTPLIIPVNISSRCLSCVS